MAVFGAIFSNELTGNLARFLPRGALPLGFDPQTAQSSPAALKHLPAAVPRARGTPSARILIG